MGAWRMDDAPVVVVMVVVDSRATLISDANASRFVWYAKGERMDGYVDSSSTLNFSNARNEFTFLGTLLSPPCL